MINEQTEKYKYDLFYEVKGYPWHYDYPGRRFEQPIGSQWHLITEAQDSIKLDLFTSYYVPLRVENLFDKLYDHNGPSYKVIKDLWLEFEVFTTALLERYNKDPDGVKLWLDDYKTANIPSIIRKLHKLSD